MNFVSQNNSIYFIYIWIISSTYNFIHYKNNFLFENTSCILLYLYLIIIHNKTSYFLWYLIKKFLILPSFFFSYRRYPKRINILAWYKQEKIYIFNSIPRLDKNQHQFRWKTRFHRSKKRKKKKKQKKKCKIRHSDRFRIKFDQPFTFVMR